MPEKEGANEYDSGSGSLHFLATENEQESIMAELVLGADLGGTSIKWGLVDRDGNIVQEERVALMDRSPDGVAAQLREVITEGIRRAEGSLLAIGIGSPGLIDAERRIVRISPNFPEWENVDLVNMIVDSANDLPVVLENDANLLAYSEPRWGAAVGKTDMVALTLGTGVGGAVLTGGVVLRGPGGGAAELGHVPLNPDGPLCGCGNRGCLEAYCNIEGTMRAAREVYGEEFIPADPEELTRRAEQGDEKAREVWQRVGFWLGVGVGGLVNTFNPQVVLIGGGLSGAGEWILGPAREVAAKRSYTPNWKETDLKLAGLLGQSGLLGAAALAFNKVG